MLEQAEQRPPATSGSQATSTAIPENHQWLAESAYYKALARGFVPNHEQDDWLEAKKDYEALSSTLRKNGLVRLRQA